MEENKASTKSPETQKSPGTEKSEIPTKNIKKNVSEGSNLPATQASPNNPENPPQQQQQQQRGGGLSIFKLVFYYYLINQVIGFFFSKSGGQHNPNLYYNLFQNDEPFVRLGSFPIHLFEMTFLGSCLSSLQSGPLHQG